MEIKPIINQVQMQDISKTTSKEGVSAEYVEVKPVMNAQGSASGVINAKDEVVGTLSVSEASVKAAVKYVNGQMKHAKTLAEFSYHEPTRCVSIKLVDADTKEVIKEIPPEKTLEMIEKMWEVAGILVDEKR